MQADHVHQAGRSNTRPLCQTLVSKRVSMNEENNKNIIAARIRRYKLINWHIHVKKIEQYFEKVIEQAKKDKFFESLYISESKEERQIQLFSGKHPIGTSEVKIDAFGNETSRKLHTEHGASLVITQSVTGEVTVILYPYSSEKATRIVSHIIWSVFEDPTKLTDSVIKSMVNDFFIYLRVSSVLFTESKFDRLRIYHLEQRSSKYTGGKSVLSWLFSHWFWVFFGFVGSIASIYSILK